MRDQRRQCRAGAQNIGGQVLVHQLQQLANQHGGPHRDERVARHHHLDQRVQQARLQKAVQQQRGMRLADVWHARRKRGQHRATLGRHEALGQPPGVLVVGRIDDGERHRVLVGPDGLRQPQQLVQQIENGLAHLQLVQVEHVDDGL